MTYPTMHIELDTYAVLDKTVKPLTDTSGRIYLPKEWIGRKVRVCLIEEPAEGSD